MVRQRQSLLPGRSCQRARYEPLTEVECGQKCFDMVVVSDLGHVSLSASLYIFDEIGYLPHSTSVFFIAHT